MFVCNAGRNQRTDACGLYGREQPRHHASMHAADSSSPTKVAEHLRDDEIHVWRLAYQHKHGRAPLQTLLAAYLGKPAEALTFVDGEHGRPSLAAPDDAAFGFNWSHSGGEALVAIGRGITPGIDLERMRERPRALQLAQRYFTTDEAAALAAVPDPRRSIAFLHLWTAKEAVLKATGRGLAFGLHRLSFSRFDEPLALHRLDGDDADAWQVHRLDLDSMFLDSTLIATLAWRGSPRSIRLCTLAAAQP